MSSWTNNMTLQDSNSWIMENLILFHDHVMIVMVMITVLIFYMLIFMMLNKFTNRFMFEGQMIEIIWTAVPMFLLFFLVFPSLKILYLTDEVLNPFMSVKILGRQWFWTFQYPGFGDKISFDSSLEVNEGESSLGEPMFRLLDVDNRMNIPTNLNLRMLVSSSDVIHSFTVPSLGIKVDAVPGRVNQVMVTLERVGLYFGQCSEICGVKHSFMPIVMESNSLANFLCWVAEYSSV